MATSWPWICGRWKFSSACYRKNDKIICKKTLNWPQCHGLLITAPSVSRTKLVSFFEHATARFRLIDCESPARETTMGHQLDPSSRGNDRNFVSTCMDQRSAQDFAWQFRRCRWKKCSAGWPREHHGHSQLTAFFQWKVSYSAAHSLVSMKGKLQQMVLAMLQMATQLHPDCSRNSAPRSAIQVLLACSSICCFWESKGQPKFLFSVLPQVKLSYVLTMTVQRVGALHLASPLTENLDFYQYMPACREGLLSGITGYIYCPRLKITSRSEIVHDHADVRTLYVWFFAHFGTYVPPENEDRAPWGRVVLRLWNWGANSI